MNTTNRGVRARLLGGVGTAVVTTMLATTSQAQPATTVISDLVDPIATASVSAHKSENALQENVAPISASVSGVTGGNTGVSNPGVQTGGSNVVSANTVQANARANRAEQAIDLALIGTTGDDESTVDGIAALAVQTSDGAPITASATTNTIATEIEDFAAGTVAVTGNAIGSDAQANLATQTVAGTTPATYASSASGQSTLAYPDGNPGFVAEGTVVVGTVQGNGTTEVDGLTAGNEISLVLTSTDGGTVAAAPTLADNGVTANAGLNRATALIDLEAGDAPTFAGSAVVSTVQANFASSASADVLDNDIVAEISGGFLDNTTLTGALSVADNQLGASASGNAIAGTTPGTAGNRVLIADGLGFAGAGTADAGTDIAYDGGDLDQSSRADIVVSSSQSNVDTFVGARANDNLVAGFVDAVAGGSVALTGNGITALANGNAASNAVASGEGAASFAASVAVANQQVNDGSPVVAEMIDNRTMVQAGFNGGSIGGSTIAVDASVLSASAYGNQVAQSVALAPTQLGTDAGEAALTGGTAPDGNVSASGQATIANLQAGYGASVNALEAFSGNGIIASSGNGTIAASSLSATGNTVEAVAAGNQGSASLSLTANSAAGGAGIASVQILDASSTVSATTVDDASGMLLFSDVTDGTLDVSGNLARAVAYGSTVVNAATVETNGLAIAPVATAGSRVSYDDATDLSFSDDAATAPEVTAAFGILNDQSTQANVSATVTDASIGTRMFGALSDSTSTVDGNVNVAAAYGNDAASALSVKAGNVATDGFAAVAAVANTQAAGADGSSILASSYTDAAAGTYVGGPVTGSTVSVSDNTVQALAYGNRTTGTQASLEANSVDSVSANNTGSASYTDITDTYQLETSATVSAQNAQAAHGAIGASLVDAGGASSTEIRLTTGSYVEDATLAADGNRLIATANGNSGVTGVALTGNLVAASSALQSFQVSDADLSAAIGVEGTPPSPGFVTNASASGNGTMSVAGDTLTVSGSPVTLTFAAHNFSAAEAAYLNSLGNVSGAVAGGNTITLGVGTIDTTVFDGFAFSSGSGGVNSGDETISLTGFSQPALPGTPNSGGVMLTVAGSIDGSRLSVDGNAAQGSVIANNAANTVLVDANSVAQANDAATAQVSLGDFDEMTVVADHSLANLQQAEGSLDSTVHATFAVDAVEGASILGSTISVSDNVQSATAVANTAANRLAADANAIEASSALASVQIGDGVSVAASSDMEVFAPAASAGSTITLSGNRNTALAVVNDATNTSTVTGTNVEGSFGNAFLVDGSQAVADHLVTNNQAAFATVSSDASTSVSNEDRLNQTGLALIDGSVTLSDNRTTAEASANRAANSLTLDGAAGSAATAGIANLQISNALVEASATATIDVALSGNGVDAALNDGTIAVTGNATTALARGNAASNALVVTSGATYGAGPAQAGSQLSPFGGQASAQAAVLNAQNNAGPVTASATSVTYGVALNGQGGSVPGAASTGSIAVTGNTVAAQAYGNTATNSVVMTALNGGTPTAAIANYQSNSGPVTATATSVNFGIASPRGTVTGSTLQTSGNQVGATAIGNNVVTTIAGQ